MRACRPRLKQQLTRRARPIDKPGGRVATKFVCGVALAIVRLGRLTMMVSGAWLGLGLGLDSG